MALAIGGSRLASLACCIVNGGPRLSSGALGARQSAEARTVKLSAAWDCALQIEVIGYRFPQLEIEPCDSNWLNIRIQTTDPGGKWKSTDPSLLT